MSWSAGSYHYRTLDFGPEPEEPKHAPRSLGKWAILLKLMVLLAFVAGGVWFCQSPVFAIADVEVEGLSHRTQDEVLGKVSLEGANLLTVPVAQVQTALTEDPWVRHVDVVRKLPNRLTLLVEERVPEAIWEGRTGRFLVSSDGILLDVAPPNSSLPVVKDVDGGVLWVGDKVSGDTAELATKLVHALPAAINQKAKSFEYLSYGGLVVETDKGKRARFGDGSDFDYKLAIWKALLQKGDTDKLKVGHVDLRFGDRPFFRDN